MRSLFTKILGWFLLTTLITSAGIAVTSALIFEASEPRRPPPAVPRPSRQLDTARNAWETGGAAALRQVLSRWHGRGNLEVYLADAQGRDVLTGKDLSEYLPAPRGSRSFFGRYFRSSFAHPSEDGKYFLITVFPHRGGPFWFLRVQHLWVLGVAILLCYALAYHLSSPVRALQRSVDRFGRGDFSARVESRRGDELGQLARAFDRMADRIQTLLTAERRLLMDISHELRSPLARLSVAIELARSDKDNELTLDRIQREADRLNELIGELLEVTRAEGDPSSQRREPLQFDTLVAEVAGDCAIEATAKNCTLKVLRNDTVEMWGNAELLRRAVENVVRNAIRYAPEDTAVEVSLTRRTDEILVRIRDYGHGVPEASLNRIFDPFYRVDTARGRDSGGVGLGLSIARRAVELHGGTLTAKNANPGLEVTLALPSPRLDHADARRQSEETVG
ncbi:MAG TPA: ATP-binding protein [Bryobacteraceae bacterium]|jgi:two-component system sensor histidine kinase CpxA|nr:ATP-binding protein [Bryobacteraceae bacterium]